MCMLRIDTTSCLLFALILHMCEAAGEGYTLKLTLAAWPRPCPQWLTFALVPYLFCCLCLTDVYIVRAIYGLSTAISWLFMNFAQSSETLPAPRILILGRKSIETSFPVRSGSFRTYEHYKTCNYLIYTSIRWRSGILLVLIEVEERPSSLYLIVSPYPAVGSSFSYKLIF